MRVINLALNLIAVGFLLFVGGFLLVNLAWSPSWAELNANLPQSAPISWLLLAENSPLNRDRVIQTACLWARLAPLPKSARHVVIDSSGELFTKAYFVRFDAQAEDIEAWLTASPGIVSEHTRLLDTGEIQYQIEPRDAAFAEVILSADRQKVIINTSWS
ncbi:MAG: hypothetical protein Kow00121_11560 [Elainellaceae cyanobacterium]